MSLSPSPRVVVEVLRAPGFPLDQFTIATKPINGSGGRFKVHLADCPKARGTVALGAGTAASVPTIEPCSCFSGLDERTRPWVALLYAAAAADRTAECLTRLEARSLSWGRAVDAEDFAIEEASLPLALGPRIFRHFPVNDTPWHLPSLRDISVEADSPEALRKVAASAAARSADNADRFLTAMRRWPTTPLWDEMFGPYRHQPGDALVISTRGRLRAAAENAFGGRDSLEAVAVVSTPVLASAPTSTCRVKDDLVAATTALTA